MPAQVQPCATCRYWDRQGLVPYGLCRIESPATSQGRHGVWPRTHAEEGCARHEPIDPNWVRDPIPPA